VNAKYPHLSKSSSTVDEHEARFRLVSDDGPGKEQAVFMIEEAGVYIASREDLSPHEWNTRVLECMAIVAQHATIQPLSIQHIGSELTPTWRTRVHHAKTLFEVFASSGPLGKMFQGMHAMQFAPYALFLIDRDDLIVCSLRIKSIGQWEADLEDTYREPLDLLFQGMVAKIGAFTKRDSVDRMMERVLRHSDTFFEGPFQRYGIELINALL